MNVQRTVLCFIHGNGSKWEAACLDFDLSVAASSEDEAKESLVRAIRLYVLGAMNEDKATRERLLNRRAPLQTQLLFRFRLARSRFARLLGRKQEERDRGFRLPCPA